MGRFGPARTRNSVHSPKLRFQSKLTDGTPYRISRQCEVALLSRRAEDKHTQTWTHRHRQIVAAQTSLTNFDRTDAK